MFLRNLWSKQKYGSLMLASMGLVGCFQGTSEVSYRNDIRPILIAYCVDCHTPGGGNQAPGQGYARNQFSMETYDELIKGTKYGPVIKPGDAVSSTLVRAVQGKLDPRIRMPHARGPLPKRDATLIRLWVDQGARNN